MKKTTFAAVLGAVLAGFADVGIDEQYLYWQITAESISAYADVSYARLYATVNGTEVGYYYGGTDSGVVSAEPYQTYTVGGDAGANWWSGLSTLDGAMFFVELFNDRDVALVTSDAATYDYVSKFMYTHYTDATKEPHTPSGSFTPYFAVPEPTGAALVLLGLAGLALRRKRLA